jgi:hypothetical protein
MKCDELEEEYLWTNNVKTPSTIMERVYNADEVDAAIAELKARIQLDDDEMAGFLQLEEECGGGDLRNYIAELKAKLADVQASAYEEMLDAGMRERRLRRALYKACANWAIWRACVLEYFCIKINAKKWEGMHHKCRAKAEQYK